MSNDDPLPSEYQVGKMLLIDKPTDWTSFDIVNKIRYRLKKLLGVKKIKVGHAGTLDPLATGLLIVCTGKATKTIDSYQGMPKEYIGTIQFGATTPSFDAETAPDQEYPYDHLTPEILRNAAQKFTGKIQQLPPMFSAIKVDGQPLYKKARKGIKVEVKAREVEVFEFDLTRIELPEVDFRIRCSKGTYIRSLAHDIGQAVESGAFLSNLRRTAIGDYRVEDAWKIEDFIAQIDERTNEALRNGQI